MAETVASAKGRLDGVEFGGHRIRLALVIGGFLDGTALELAWGPNWIIEARGTGKTTVLKLVRFALDTLPAQLMISVVGRRVGTPTIRQIRIVLPFITTESCRKPIRRAIPTRSHNPPR